MTQQELIDLSMNLVRISEILRRAPANTIVHGERNVMLLKTGIDDICNYMDKVTTELTKLALDGEFIEETDPKIHKEKNEMDQAEKTKTQ